MFIPIRQRTVVVHSRSHFSFIIERHYNIIDMCKNLTKKFQENIKKCTPFVNRWCAFSYIVLKISRFPIYTPTDDQ